MHDLHRDEIAAALRAAGLDVRTEIGLSDFTVDLAVSAGAGAHWVAVLLDGPGWAKRQTVSDRDAVPTTVLRGTMGWSKVERVWLPSWLSERADVVARIVQSAKDVAVQPAELEPTDSAEVRSTVETAVASGAELHLDPGLALGLDQPDFVAADDSPTAGGRDLLDRLNERRVFDHVRAVAAEIIRVESPIEATRLTKIVGRRFGLQRVVGTRSAVILAVVPRDLMHSSALGTFVWAKGMLPDSYRAFRPTPAGVDRSVNEIAPEEIANAMEHVARIGHGVTPDELLRETAAIFGVHRLTEPVRARLEQTLDWAVAAGRLREDGGRIYV